MSRVTVQGFLSMIMLVVSMLLAASEIYADVLSLQSIKLPPGFTITVYADHVTIDIKIRSGRLALGPSYQI